MEFQVEKALMHRLTLGNKKRGYMLLEVIVSVVLLSLAGLALHSISSNRHMSLTNTEYLTMVSELATKEKEYRFFDPKPTNNITERKITYAYKASLNSNQTYSMEYRATLRGITKSIKVYANNAN